jgi:hypothetical protein
MPAVSYCLLACLFAEGTGESWSNGLGVRQSPGGKDVSTEVEEYLLLGAVIRQRLVNALQTEKAWSVL